MTKLFAVTVLVLVKLLGSEAFWSLDTDLQLGYEIYDKSYEINAVIQAIVSASSRNNVIQSDDATKFAVNSLSSISNQLRNSPVSFFAELAYAASSRSNNEAWLLTRIRNNYANFDASLNSLLNATGIVKNLDGVSNPDIIESIRASLLRVQIEAREVLSSAETISSNVSRVRANSSLLLTPELLNDFIDPDAASQLVSSLTAIRHYLATLLSTVKDAGRLVVAHGSVHELLSRSITRDTTARNTALNSFINNYNRVRNNLLSSVTSYKQAAETGIYNFIARVQSTYDDNIVRPKFDQLQLPLIQSFGNTITSKVYNHTFFQTSFDEMRDQILISFSNATNSSLYQGSEHREVILDLQRKSFVRHYSHCLDELVAEAQQNSNSVTSKYAFCLNERTSGIVVVIPSTSTWLSVIRDNINFILLQLNACLNGLTSVAGRSAISDCIQFNANNLAFYSAYLPITVESNLKPVVQSTPLIFENCMRLVPSSTESRFNEIYVKCRGENELQTTTSSPTEAPTDAPTEEPTEEPSEGSGSDIFN